MRESNDSNSAAAMQGSSVRRQLSVHVERRGACGRVTGAPVHQSDADVVDAIVVRHGGGRGTAFLRADPTELDIEAPRLFHSAYDRASRPIDSCLRRPGGHKGCAVLHIQDDDRSNAGRRSGRYARRVPWPLSGSDRFANDLKWVTTYESFLRTGERNGIRVGHDRAMLEAADVIPAAVVARRDEIWPLRDRRAGDARRVSRVRCCIRTFISGTGTSRVTGRMGLCDWACVCSGHWARDFAYAVSTTLTVEQRRGWERELLARYLQQMRENCRTRHADIRCIRCSIGCQLFAALLMWTPTLCHPPTMPDMQPPEMSREMIHRMTTAIDDLDALDWRGAGMSDNIVPSMSGANTCSKNCCFARRNEPASTRLARTCRSDADVHGCEPTSTPMLRNQRPGVRRVGNDRRGCRARSNNDGLALWGLAAARLLGNDGTRADVWERPRDVTNSSQGVRVEWENLLIRSICKSSKRCGGTAAHQTNRLPSN